MAQAPSKRMNVFERYLSLWVAACMVLGVVIGKTLPGVVGAVRDLEFGEGSQINIPIAILIWLMIYPMMLKIDFASIRGVGKRPDGPHRHPRRELAREALLDGVPRLAVLQAPLPAADRAPARERVRGRRHHPRRRALHGHGLRLVATCPTATPPTRSSRSP